MNKCLIVVDYQYDFSDPHGSLYVNGGELIKDGIINKINEYKSNNNLVVFTGDFHPQNHVSFTTWPIHCLINTKGSEFVIDKSNADLIIKKGTQIDSDSYSGFYVGTNIDSGLKTWLNDHNVTDLEICGLALDVCVKATHDDAVKLGFNSKILFNLTKSIK